MSPPLSASWRCVLEIGEVAPRQVLLWHQRDLLLDQTDIPPLDSTLRGYFPYPD